MPIAWAFFYMSAGPRHKLSKWAFREKREGAKKCYGECPRVKWKLFDVKEKLMNKLCSTLRTLEKVYYFFLDLIFYFRTYFHNAKNSRQWTALSLIQSFHIIWSRMFGLISKICLLDLNQRRESTNAICLWPFSCLHETHIKLRSRFREKL